MFADSGTICFYVNRDQIQFPKATQITSSGYCHIKGSSYLAAPLSEVEGLTYQVTSCGSTNRIQIGTPFYVTVTGRCYLGGFWKLNLVPIDMKANGAGVSEHYWK